MKEIDSGWRRSFARTRGWRPFLYLALFLALTEVLLQVDPIYRAAVAATDAFWLDRWLTARAEDVLPLHEDVQEEPVLEAYFRGVARQPAGVKVLLVGDSIIWQVVTPPSLAGRLSHLLNRRLPGADVKIYRLCSPGQGQVATYYFLKAALRRFKPDLVVYEANNILLGHRFANDAWRNMGFVDRDFVSAAEQDAYQRLLLRSEPMQDGYLDWPFAVGQKGYRLLYGSRIRALLLPPSVFMGLGGRCYSDSCQVTNDKYWRDMLKKAEEGDEKYLDNFARFDYDQNNLNFVYLTLTPDLLRQKGLPFVMTLPPKNEDMLEALKSKTSVMDAGERLVRALRDLDVPLIDCQHAVPETDFRDTQHLRPAGVQKFAECLAPGVAAMIEEIIKKKDHASETPASQRDGEHR